MNWLSDKSIEHLRTVTGLPDLSQTKYTCVEKIASGGMASVYLAEDTQLRRTIALKILDIPDPEKKLAARMLQEAHVIAALEHPSIVPIHDVGTLPDERVFYTMKFVKGWRLDEHVDRTSSLPELLRIFQKVCEGVGFAHARKVIHRDLKPENIMVGDFGEVLVMDWGLAKLLAPTSTAASDESTENAGPGPARNRRSPGALSPQSENLTEHGAVLGTPAYMSPEQQRGEIDRIDERTDIYALGAILDFLLRDQPENTVPDEPKRRSFWQALQKRKTRKVPKQLTAIADKALSEHKNDRYAKALEMRDDIENYLNGFRVSAYQENVLEFALRWLRQNRFLILLILTYIVAQLVIRLISRL